MAPSLYMADFTMAKAIDWFLWGLFMGMGWAVSNGLLNFIVSILSKHN